MLQYCTALAFKRNATRTVASVNRRRNADTPELQADSGEPWSEMESRNGGEPLHTGHFRNAFQPGNQIFARRNKRVPGESGPKRFLFDRTSSRRTTVKEASSL